jgi:hypothetical protein
MYRTAIPGRVVPESDHVAAPEANARFWFATSASWFGE